MLNTYLCMVPEYHFAFNYTPLSYAYLLNFLCFYFVYFLFIFCFQCQMHMFFAFILKIVLSREVDAFIVAEIEGMSLWAVSSKLHI